LGFEIGRIEPLPYSSDDALQKYEASGRIPWSEGYEFPVQPDKAASARAVACMQIVK
jgi:hypothetical protein